MLIEEQIRKHLDLKLDLRFMLYESVGSTNIMMKQFSDQPEGLVIAATKQTDGRGRLSNRRFFSPANSGLYLSILLKPKNSAEDATIITSLAAVAVCETIEALSNKKAMIKWVNDIYVNGKKVCGILTQGSINAQGSLDYAILGIGVNLTMPSDGFPKDIENKAGVVFNSVSEADINLFSATLLNNIFRLYSEFSCCEIANLYRNRSLVLNQKITVLNEENSYDAYVNNIDDSCNLLVTTDNGEQKTISSGEVSITIPS